MSLGKRFTLDGSEALEAHLAQLCARVAKEVGERIPAARLEGLVLGGGYGRGQGGVWRTAREDQPYNDLEFYVFLNGPRLLNERRYRPKLQALGEALTPQAGLHVEFKVDALERLRRSPITMFSYDLVAGHRLLHGRADLFRGCEHHLRPAELPLAEATRLLFNRCTGLLMVRELLVKAQLTDEEGDFVNRNLAKARLALGDALLTAFGLYHWSCLERWERMTNFAPTETVPGLEQLRKDHATGVQFKLHPKPAALSMGEFSAEHHRLCALASSVWLWLESRRLGRPFATVEEYGLSSLDKCPETLAWRNCLLSLRSFGPAALLNSGFWRYPRERLFNSLPLLLWGKDPAKAAGIVRHLQEQLHTRAADWDGLVSAYKKVWADYG